MNEWIESLFKSESASSLVVELVPKILGVMLILILGLLLGWLASKLTRALVRKTRVESLLEKAHLPNVMYKLGLHKSFADLSAKTVFWIVIVISVFLALDAAGIEALNNFLPTLVAYLPRVLVALIIFVCALFAAQVLSDLTEKITARNEAIESPKVVSKVVYAVVVSIGLLISLEQLGIDIDVAHQIVAIATGSVFFGTALSIALGARPIVTKMISRYYAERFIRTGDHVEFDDVSGRLIQFGPVIALIETDDGFISVPCNEFLEQRVRIRRSEKSSSTET